LSAVRYKFNEFELDGARFELTRKGRALKVERIPLELLILLVEKNGEVGTRQEIIARLWGKDVFVDTDQGINTAVRKIRTALRDDAEKSRYIQTVSGKGYRFIAATTTIPPGSSNGGAEDESSKNTVQDLTPRGEAGRGDFDRLVPIARVAEHDSIAIAVDNKSSAPHKWRQLQQHTPLGLLTIMVVGLAFWYRAPLPAPRVLGYTPITHDRERKYRPMVTDGTRLYFMSPKKTGWTIAEVSASGGETAPIPSHSVDIWLCDISPNGSELLLTGQGEFLFILPLPTGLPRRVGSILAHDASWSPDGAKIVYAHGNELFLAKPDGSESHRLVTLAGPASWLRWSPDGKILRFTVEDTSKTGSVSLWEVASDGTGLRPLLPGRSTSSSECCGNWTPDGNYFVFVSARAANTSSLWAIREKSGFLRKHNPEPTQLTMGTNLIFAPVPSRDGKKLFAIQGAPLGELVRRDAKSQQFLPYFSGISATQLSFSKDGQWVAFRSYPDGTLWRSKVDGTERLQLTYPPMYVLQPQWSPDGKQIAFGADMPGKRTHVYIVSADGGVPEQVTKGERYDLSPSWALSGDSLFFEGGSLDLAGVAARAIYRLNLKTNQLSTLSGSEGMATPRLSPDDHYIAAVSSTNHLMLLEMKTQNWIELTRTTVDDPVWSHDGKYVYFNSIAEGEPAFYRVQIKDHKLERVASLKDVKRPTEGSFLSWTGLTPDDSLLALRDISNYDVYALDWQLP
jgi:Tol biopolymer transport system component/DNA-binding winged helix-turn-helix (wHTH) protein